MKYIQKFEDIKIPINIGDTVLGGRFKNKKIIVKKIGKNKKGDITINDKPLLKFRLLESLNNIEEYCDLNLVNLTDNDYQIRYSNTNTENNSIIINIVKPDNSGYKIFQWDDIKDTIIPFFEFIDKNIKDISFVLSNNSDINNLSRISSNKTDIINDTISVKNCIIFRFTIVL